MCKKSLAKLAKKGYNLNEISKYALDSRDKLQYDEVYTEYRVKTMLRW